LENNFLFSLSFFIQKKKKEEKEKKFFNEIKKGPGGEKKVGLNKSK